MGGQGRRDRWVGQVGNKVRRGDRGSGGGTRETRQNLARSGKN